MSQRWEYKWISVARAAKTAGDWTIWSENDNPLSTPVAIGSKIRELGDQGWELISVTPISNHAGGVDIAGFTSQVSYFFKRPLPPATPPMLSKG
jgi:hypothetical protein